MELFFHFYKNLETYEKVFLNHYKTLRFPTNHTKNEFNYTKISARIAR